MTLGTLSNTINRRQNELEKGNACGLQVQCKYLSNSFRKKYWKLNFRTAPKKNLLDFINFIKGRYYTGVKLIMTNFYSFPKIAYLPLQMFENCLRKSWISTVHSQPKMEQHYHAAPAVPNQHFKTTLVAGFADLAKKLWHHWPPYFFKNHDINFHTISNIKIFKLENEKFSLSLPTGGQCSYDLFPLYR